MTPLEKITSMADLYHKMKSDNRYESIIIESYKESGYVPKNMDLEEFEKITYKSSIEWVESWVNEQAVKYNENCMQMVRYLNGFIEKFNCKNRCK